MHQQESSVHWTKISQTIFTSHHIFQFIIPIYDFEYEYCINSTFEQIVQNKHTRRKSLYEFSNQHPNETKTPCYRVQHSEILRNPASNLEIGFQREEISKAWMNWYFTPYNVEICCFMVAYCTHKRNKRTTNTRSKKSRENRTQQAESFGKRDAGKPFVKSNF